MKRRILMGLLLDGKTGRAFHGDVEPSSDELEIITRRQAMRVLEPATPDKMPRDWRLTIAAVCIGVSLAGLVMGVVLALVWP